MEQGTGKTLVTIAFFHYLLEHHGLDRYVIICPLSVVDVWVSLLNRHWEECPPIYLSATNLLRLPQGPCVIILNYEKLVRLKKAIKAWSFDVAVVDESHRIKNHNSKQSKACANLSASIRMILTGTPIGNNPMDLFGQFRFLDPMAFGKTITPFREKYCRKGGLMNLKWKMRETEVRGFMRIVNRYAFRVSNKVLGLPPEGPPLVRYFTLTPRERQVYDELVEEMVTSSQGFTVTTPLVVSQLMKLRQVTGGFIKDDEGGIQKLGGSKLAVLADYLRNDLPPGEPFVVFCVFRQEIEEISKLLKQLKIKFGLIHGGIDPVDRAIATRELGKTNQAVVCQLAAGGVGIDLTGAALAIFFSVDFSFINYYQARARIYRHGQTKNVVNLHLMAKKTIDEDCYSALLDKEDVSRRALAHLRKEIRRHG